MAIFAMLPGIIIASVLANVAILVLASILIYLIAHHRKWYILEIIALTALFLLHSASILFFVAIALYGAMNKEKRTLFFGSAFVIILLFLGRGIEIGGIPKGHFVEIFCCLCIFIFSVYFYILCMLFIAFGSEKKEYYLVHFFYGTIFSFFFPLDSALSLLILHHIYL